MSTNSMKMKHLTVGVACILASIAFSQDLTIPKPKLITYAITNLNDNLKTEVTYPDIPSFSIKRLDKLSQVTDRHKKQHTKTRLDTQVTDLVLDVYKVKTIDPTVPEVRMAKKYNTAIPNKPLYVMSNKIVLDPLKTKDIYVNRLAGETGLASLSVKDITKCLVPNVSRNELKSIIIRSLLAKNSSVSNLSIGNSDVASVSVNDLSLSKSGVSSLYLDELSPDSFNLSNLSLDSVLVKKYGDLLLDISSLDVKSLGLTDSQLAKLDIKNLTLTDLAVYNLISSSKITVIPTVTSLELEPVFGDSMYFDSLSLTSWDVEQLTARCLEVTSLISQQISPEDLALFNVKMSDMSAKDLDIARLRFSSLLSTDKMAIPYLLVRCGLNPDDVKKMSIKEIYTYIAVHKQCVTDLKITPQQLRDMSVIYKELYCDFSVEHIIVDNSMFSIIVEEDDIKNLNYLTEIYKFSKKYSDTPWCLKSLSKLDIAPYRVWMKTLIDNKDCNIEFVRNKKTYQIIGEAKLEHDENSFTSFQQETMEKNLKILKKMGYDTVLVRFYADNDIDEVLKMIAAIHDQGFRVYSVYVGLEGPDRVRNGENDWNPFDNTPNEVEDAILKVAAVSEGWLLGWRGTSFHANIFPAEFFNFICNTVRKANPECLIYGEIYYGRIGPTRSLQSMVYNAPKNVTGLCINNMGYYGYNHAYVVNRLFTKAIPGYNKMDKIAQVIGYAPYYRSRNDMYFQFDEEYTYKQKVEKSFHRARCGTVTMLHDGVDDGYVDFGKYWTCDNILTDRSFLYKYEEETPSGK